MYKPWLWEKKNVICFLNFQLPYVFAFKMVTAFLVIFIIISKSYCSL